MACMPGHVTKSALHGITPCAVRRNRDANDRRQLLCPAAPLGSGPRWRKTADNVYTQQNGSTQVLPACVRVSCGQTPDAYALPHAMVKTMQRPRGLV